MDAQVAAIGPSGKSGIGFWANDGRPCWEETVSKKPRPSFARARLPARARAGQRRECHGDCGAAQRRQRRRRQSIRHPSAAHHGPVTWRGCAPGYFETDERVETAHPLLPPAATEPDTGESIGRARKPWWQWGGMVSVSTRSVSTHSAESGSRNHVGRGSFQPSLGQGSRRITVAYRYHRRKKKFCR
jgi:hypothetical protein